MKLTKTRVDEATYTGDASKNERCFVWDGEVRGFGLRVYPGGSKSFVLSYRAGGRKRLIAIGRYGNLTVEQARSRAVKHIAAVIDGSDPLISRQNARIGETVAGLCDSYMERYLIHRKAQRDIKRRIEHIIKPAWRSRRVDSIIRQDVARLHGRVGKNNGPYEANRTLALISKMFELAVVWGFVPDEFPNPARRIEKFEEKKRDRWLTPEELPRLVEAIDQEVNDSAKFAIWLYLLTGLRKDELLRAKWEDIDRARAEIRIAETKAGRTHYVPLSHAALAVLDEIPRHPDNPYILVGSKPGHHLVNISKPWGRIRTAAGIEDVRIHDLRRTVGSWLAQSGNSLHLIGRVLNHSNTSTTAIYARFGEDHVREALERHGDKILGIAGKKEPADVVPIKKR